MRRIRKSWQRLMPPSLLKRKRKPWLQTLRGDGTSLMVPITTMMALKFTRMDHQFRVSTSSSGPVTSREMMLKTNMKLKWLLLRRRQKLMQGELSRKLKEENGMNSMGRFTRIMGHGCSLMEQLLKESIIIRNSRTIIISTERIIFLSCKE